VTGKLTIESERVSLTSVAAAAVDSQRPAAADAGVTLLFAAPPEDPIALGDAARLQQVVTNLVSNALKFTPSGGTISVELAGDGQEGSLTVSDTGIGIAPDFLPHVFEQFRQADASTTRRQGGLGLGLAIVRRLVEMHGGSVSAHSEGIGRGATFEVRLPLAEAAAAAVHDPIPERAALAGISVLLVDDDPDGREFLAAVLEHRGARVSAVATATEGLARAQIEAPDILLSDIAMPGADGYTLVQQLHALMPGIPAAAVTACVSPEDRARAAAAGFDLHLGKPVDPDELVAAVQALCRRAPRQAR
jgi:CheY-like chemotaxis protein